MFKKPNVLFITQQWTHGEPQYGISQTDHVLVNSLRSTDYANICIWSNDHYYHLTGGNDPLDILRVLCFAHKFDLIALNLFGSPDLIYDPPFDTISTIKNEYKLPIVSFWWDTVYNIINTNRYQSLCDLCFCADSDINIPNIINPEKCIHDPTLLDTTLFCNKNLYRDIDFSFIGTNHGGIRSQYINAFNTQNKIPFLQLGGQNKITHEQYANILQRSKITWNISWSESGMPQLKGRMFEATTCGSLLFDWNGAKNMISPWFTEGKHYIGYDSPEDAIEKVRYYLDNDNERLSIALQGHQRALEICNPKTWWKKNVFDRLRIQIN